MDRFAVRHPHGRHRPRGLSSPVAVVVTLCPLCNTALVFERTLDGVVHDFGTTGNLYFSDLVMYDRQTESWWQQATGASVVGEQMGTQLERVVSADHLWFSWAAFNPETRIWEPRTAGLSEGLG